MNDRQIMGMSLSPAYLAGHPDAPERRWYGPVDALLRDLADASVQSVELRAVGPGTDVALARAAALQVRSAGFAMTIHGVLPPAGCGSDWQEAVPALVALLEWLRDERARTRGDASPDVPSAVTVHAYAAEDGDARSLAARSAARLAEMGAWVEAQEIPAVLAVELNRAKKTVDPCVTYEGVLSVSRGAGSSRVGICYDFGHAWSNTLTEGLSEDAPDGFLRRAVHTHIHDVGPTGRTHWPLTEGRLPLEDFIRRLAGVSYRGVWNLELSPERFAAEGDCRRRVIDSARRLRAALKAGMTRRHESGYDLCREGP